MNGIEGDVKKILTCPFRIKKQQREPPPKAPQMDRSPLDIGHRMHMSHQFCTGLHQPRPSPVAPPPLVPCSTVAATTPRSGASRPPRTRRRRAVVVEVEVPSDGSRRGRLMHRRQGGGAGGRGLPQLVGRQVEKVRQCRIVLVSLPSAQPHTPV
jgi:hypothetical protein